MTLSGYVYIFQMSSVLLIQYVSFALKSPMTKITSHSQDYYVGFGSGENESSPLCGFQVSVKHSQSGKPRNWLYKTFQRHDRDMGRWCFPLKSRRRQILGICASSTLFYLKCPPGPPGLLDPNSKTPELTFPWNLVKLVFEQVSGSLRQSIRL